MHASPRSFLKRLAPLLVLSSFFQVGIFAFSALPVDAACCVCLPPPGQDLPQCSFKQFPSAASCATAVSSFAMIGHCHDLQADGGSVCPDGSDSDWVQYNCREWGVRQGTRTAADGTTQTVTHLGGQDAQGTTEHQNLGLDHVPGQTGAVDEGTANFSSLTPVLSVPIPGVHFTPATLSGGEVTVPFLAQYILGVYRFAIGAAAILASIMVVYGGFRYLLGSTLGDVKEGKTVIQNAVIGLVVLLCSYVILQSVNPDLVNLKPLRLSYVVRDAAGENSWNGQGGSNVSGAGDGSCPQGGQIVTQELDGRGSFKVMPISSPYKQFTGPWKDIGYGPDLVNNQSPYPCRCGCQQNRAPAESCPSMGGGNACPDHGNSEGGNHAFSAAEHMCAGTIAQGGCGPTSFAVAMAYYGVQVSDAGSTQLAEQGRFWKSGGTNNSPDNMSSNAGWSLVSAHDSDPQLENALRARAQPHLYDPLDAARDAVRLGSRRTVNGGTSTEFMNRAATEHDLRAVTIPPGAGRAVAVGDHVRAGHPVVFLCKGCHLVIGSGTTDKTYGGHFMVIHGANDANTFFLVSDVGSSERGKSYLSAEQLNGSSVDDLLAITPSNGGPGQCRGNGQTTAGSGGNDISGSTAPTTAGGLTTAYFDYRPSGGQGWNENQSVILFPERLTREFATISSGGGTRPRLRAYVFIHGGPGGAQKLPNQALYYSYMRTALQSVAGSKNIVILAPHYFGLGLHPDPGGAIDPETHAVRQVPVVPFMNRFNLGSFYETAIAAAVHAIPGSQASDFVDVVVGGHSAANCDGQVTQAIDHPLANQRGVVFYDGCLGYSQVTPSQVPSPTVGDSKGSIYFNPDQSGMGHGYGDTVRSGWGLSPITCPASVTDIVRRTECFSRVIGGTGAAHREIVSYETHLGHRESVLPMTRFMFNAFYANDR